MALVLNTLGLDLAGFGLEYPGPWPSSALALNTPGLGLAGFGLEYRQPWPSLALALALNTAGLCVAGPWRRSCCPRVDQSVDAACSCARHALLLAQHYYSTAVIVLSVL